jgi:hypothetical protein
MPEQPYWHHYVHKRGEWNVPLLRHGAAHLWGYHKGTKGYPDGTGQRRDVQLGAEWHLFGRGHGLGFEVKVGTNGSEDHLRLALYASRLGSLWLKASGIVPYSWLERHKADGTVDYQSRITGARISISSTDSPVVQWNVWAPRDGFSRAERRWWREGYVNLQRWIFGPTNHERLGCEEGTCVVPMPEANYPATWKREQVRWVHTNLLGHLRDVILGYKVATWTEITPGKPVPVPGKGENAWDCDDDAIHSISIAGTSLEDAIGKLVGSALRTRQRHGGQHMSVPS